MASNIYGAILLTGGGTGALDAIDGSTLVDGDSAIVQTDGTIYFYHLDATSGAAESSPDTISPDTSAGTKRWIKQTVSGGGTTPDYIRLHDSKATTVSGGTFTQDAWQKRDITEDQDLGGHCSVASSVITLAAGTYDCHIACPSYRVLTNRAKLVNTSDTADTLLGICCHGSNVGSAGEVTMVSHIMGRFVIAAEKTFEIQHRCSVTKTTSGFGVASSFGEAEIYTVAEFWKVA